MMVSMNAPPRRLAAAALLTTVALFAAPAIADAPPPAPPTAEAAAVKKLFEQKLPGATVRSVVKTPYFGLFEIQLEDRIMYTDAKANYMVVGSIYDANTKKNLTEARQRELNKVAFDSLPLNLSFTRVKGNGERKLAIFLDADCPIVRARRAEEHRQRHDLHFLFPIDQLQPDAAKSRTIWCPPDKAKAWTTLRVRRN